MQLFCIYDLRALCGFLSHHSKLLIDILHPKATLAIESLSRHGLKRSLQTIICLLAALHLVGGHWGAMQLVAWATMIRDFSQDRPLAQALSDTFDGEHPCPMCCKVNAGQSEERKERPVTGSGAEKALTWQVLVECKTIPSPCWRPTLEGLGFVPPRLQDGCLRSRPVTPPPQMDGRV